ncbi:hypothetical protein [Planktotalea sp.]|uniref:hypothetical protein n=1 Tax=Planktotalea sp. TaxID=2029877 RepID=UPI0025CCB9B9|nr:hypothetical protein [Planktotalea sp.]
MILPKALKYWHIQACFAQLASKAFSLRQTVRNLLALKMCQILLLFGGAAFRNPSPWRPSGAYVHGQPLFFFGGSARFNFERVKLYQKQLRSSQLSFCLYPLQPLLVATRAKLSQPASSVRQLARLSQQTNENSGVFCGDTGNALHISERRFAPTGRVAFSRFR